MSWVQQAREFLEASRVKGGAWGYHAGAQASAEPTAFVILAKAAMNLREEAAANWLAAQQLEDGGVPIQPDRKDPTWPTPHAILAWLADGGHPESVARGVAYLKARRGKTWDPKRTPDLGHDTSIPGWPWVAGTHSWVEPTAYAVCALRSAGDDSERLAQGRALLGERVVKGGGWNYGNTTVLGTELRAFPAPTGLALVAMLPEQGQLPAIQTSVTFLERAVANVRSPVSLSWSLLGLHAADRSPADAPTWLEASFKKMSTRGLRTLDVSLLLLAAHAATATKLFGSERAR